MSTDDELFFESDDGLQFDDEPFLKVDRDDFIELRDAHNHTVSVVRVLQRLVNLSLFMNIFLFGFCLYLLAEINPSSPDSIQNPLIQEQQEVTK